MIRLAVLLAALLVSANAFAQNRHGLDLVTSLSSDVISIQSNFTGTEIVIFGQAQNIVRQPNDPSGYELAIVVEGPPQDITTRRKGRFLGVWVNREAERFQNVPSFMPLPAPSTSATWQTGRFWTSSVSA